MCDSLRAAKVSHLLAAAYQNVPSSICVCVGGGEGVDRFEYEITRVIKLSPLLNLQNIK